MHKTSMQIMFWEVHNVGTRPPEESFPEEAAEGTIRKLYAESKAKNAVHGSDSDENAQIESDFHFGQNERF